MNKKRIYYPALDGLRFFAFLSVFLHHALFNISSENLVLNYFLIIFNKNGWVGVDLFFVLSGFLITTILLEEKKLYGKYSLKDFWIRRSLRIWPLYYLALFSGFLLVPYLFKYLFNTDYTDSHHLNQMRQQIIYYLFFLGNWAVFKFNYSGFPEISHLWTISIEEQFYLLWPLILLFLTKYRTALLTCLLLIISSILTRLYLSLVNTPHPGIYVNTFSRMDALTLGSLIALTLHFHPNFINKITNLTKPIILITTSIILSFILYRVTFLEPQYLRQSIFGYTFIALFMSYYTISALSNNFFSKILSYSLLTYLGKISYGLYVWHLLAIDITAKLLPNKFQDFKFIPAFFITLVISIISYRLFELRFLKFKKRFSKINSRPV